MELRTLGRTKCMPQFSARTSSFVEQIADGCRKSDLDPKLSSSMATHRRTYESSTTIVVLPLCILVSILTHMDVMDQKPLTIWIIEDNDEYRQVLADGLRLDLKGEVRAFASPEEALRACGRGSGIPGGGGT